MNLIWCFQLSQNRKRLFKLILHLTNLKEKSLESTCPKTKIKGRRARRVKRERKEQLQKQEEVKRIKRKAKRERRVRKVRRKDQVIFTKS